MTTEGSIGGTDSGTGMTSGDSSIVNRMIRAARLDVNVYEEVEADRTATSQAAIVVAITAVAGAIGGALGGDAGGAIAGIVGGVVWAFFYWVVWSYLTYFIGTRFFGGTATPGELLRTLGFASTPNILKVLIFIPAVGPIIGFAASVWSLVAGVIAVRQALDFDTSKAILTTVIAWVITMIPIIFFGGILAALFIGMAAGTPTTP
jgi:hypothetical protein